ncbi:MAG: DPP IV N-terminal domain-containing protein [Candidatus Acidoferrales bacterium]
MKRAFFLLVVLCLAVIAPLVRAQQAEQTEREAMYYRYLEFASLVKGGSIQPHWMADGSSFWYTEGGPANTVIWKVDPKEDTKNPLFDTARLRQVLTDALDHEPPYQGLPFDKFTFVEEGEKAVKFTVEGKEFILQLDTYTIARAPVLSEEEKNRLVPRIGQKGLSGWPEAREVLSPDRRWFASLKEHNLWLRSTYDGRSVQITSDGVKDYQWAAATHWQVGPWAVWSPDSFKLAVKKEDSRAVESVLVAHWLKPSAEVEWFHKPRTGGPLPQTKLFVVDILSKRQVRLDTGEEPDHYFYILGWRPDGSELLFLRTDREHKKLDLMAANPNTGATRVVLTETQKTFVIRPTYFRDWMQLFTLLEDGNRFIWMSERDGWNHLYLYDREGNLIRRLTEGPFPVLRPRRGKGVVAVDEKAGWVYFTALAEQRLYDGHLYRVNLEGKGFKRLTEETGWHTIQFAPSKEFFLDTHSTVDRPPVVELRRADGTLLQTLSKANIDALKELKWSPPEEFVVKAVDGKTDLYGVLYKPYDFDPNKKYPVIDHIYAGPQRTNVPRTFIHWPVPQALAQLGFIVFGVDARGTPGRGKEFQDVVYGHFGRHEIPDHVATLQQLAEKRPYMDLSRAGIYGYSWGGYFTIRAMLLAPDVYHVGIAGSPPVDAYTGATIYEPYWGYQKQIKRATSTPPTLAWRATSKASCS